MAQQKTLSQQIREYNRQVLQLKTGASVAPMIRGFNASIYVDGEQPASGSYLEHYRITYDSGSQPILTEFSFGGLVWPQLPSGNTQEIYTYSQVVGTLYITSTRPIISVVRV